MARITIRIQERTFVVHLLAHDVVSIRLTRDGEPPQHHTTRIVDDSMESVPSWLTPKLARQLLATLLAAASTRSSGVRAVASRAAAAGAKVKA